MRSLIITFTCWASFLLLGTISQLKSNDLCVIPLNNNCWFLFTANPVDLVIADSRPPPVSAFAIKPAVPPVIRFWICALSDPAKLLNWERISLDPDLRELARLLFSEPSNVELTVAPSNALIGPIPPSCQSAFLVSDIPSGIGNIIL